MKETITNTCAISFAFSVVIFSLWFVFTHPVKTPPQIREQTYQMCVDRYTLYKSIGGDISSCDKILLNFPTEQ